MGNIASTVAITVEIIADDQTVDAKNIIGNTQTTFARLPLQAIAPCLPEGRIVEIDYDAREEACICSWRECLVDRNLNILGPGIDLLDRTWDVILISG